MLSQSKSGLEFSMLVGLFLVPMVAGCNWLNSNAPRPLARAARLEIYLVSPTAVANSQAATYADTGATIYLLTPPIITSADIATIQKSEQTPGHLGLAINLLPAGGQKLAAATTPAAGKSMAIVVNGEVVFVAKLVSTLSNDMRIEGGGLSKRC